MKKFILSLFSGFAAVFFAVCTAAAHIKYAIVQNPVIGRARNSAGGMTFTTLFGQNIMKAKIFQINDAKSAAQLLVRAAQKTCVKIIASISSSARSVFETQPSTMSAYSKLISQLQSVWLGNSPYGLSDDAVFGQGTIDTVKVAGAYTTDVLKAWEFDITGTPLASMGSAGDVIHILFINTTAEFAQLITTSETRGDLVTNGTFDSRYTADDDVWGFIAFYNGTSDTQSCFAAGADLANKVK